MIEEGEILEINGQKFLVVFVEYSGSYNKPWVKNLELKGIKENTDDQ
jgi:hypothetical protein